MTAGLVNLEDNREDQYSKKLGIITIGQSPRVDLTADMFKVLSKDIEVVEKGLLDEYTLNEVEHLFAPQSGDHILVSRMRDGTQVRLSESQIFNRLQGAILALEKEVDVILLLCTGALPKVQSSKPLIMPKPLIKSVVDALRDDHKIGLVIPDAAQRNMIEEWWQSQGIESEICIFSPYDVSEDILNISFRETEIEYVVMDCMGYSEDIKNRISKQTGKKVILPRTLLARIINEIMA